jgi:hypothetical protein
MPNVHHLHIAAFAIDHQRVSFCYYRMCLTKVINQPAIQKGGTCLDQAYRSCLGADSLSSESHEYDLFRVPGFAMPVSAELERTPCGLFFYSTGCNIVSIMLNRFCTCSLSRSFIWQTKPQLVITTEFSTESRVGRYRSDGIPHHLKLGN